MALELQRGRSKWWYGRVEVNGRKIGKNLGVEVRGIIPNSLAETGDIAFERSRAKAQAALEKLQLDLKRRSTAEELVQTLHELRTGARVGSIPLDEIAARWSALPRRRPLSQSYLKQAESWISRFVLFLKKTNGSLREMSQVQSSICRAFFKAEEERGVTAKTYNNTLIFLRAVFHALRKDAGLAEDPFEGIPTKDGETVFRKPFTHEDLALIEEKARSDEFIYPLIVTGMCTAMRRGDCCTLLRECVDLFDVHGMFQRFGLTPEIVECFVSYLAGHNRPVHEVLNSRDIDLSGPFAAEFAGMEREPVALAALDDARKRLRLELRASLTGDQKHFLLGLVAGDPPWEAMRCKHLAELPAIQWKLQNLARLKKANPAKFAAQSDELKRCFAA